MARITRKVTMLATLATVTCAVAGFAYLQLNKPPVGPVKDDASFGSKIPGHRKDGAEALDQLWEPAPPEVFVERILTAPSLLRLADSREFRRAKRSDRISILRKWIAGNANQWFSEMSKNGQKDAEKLLEDRLDDLLTEKDFKVPRG